MLDTRSPAATAPTASSALQRWAGELCTSSGGLFIDLSPVAYNCVFLNLTTNQRRAEASRICTKANKGRFVNISPLEYSCVVPKKA